MKKYGKIFMNGIIDENPTFRMVLGMCPTLAITTAASNGIGMGLAVTFVLIFSNLVISLLRKVIPDSVRIPCCARRFRIRFVSLRLSWSSRPLLRLFS